MLVGKADRHGLEASLAYVCILDNAAKPHFSFGHLRDCLAEVPPDERVQILFHSIGNQ